MENLRLKQVLGGWPLVRCSGQQRSIGMTCLHRRLQFLDLGILTHCSTFDAHSQHLYIRPMLRLVPNCTGLYRHALVRARSVSGLTIQLPLLFHHARDRVGLWIRRWGRYQSPSAPAAVFHRRRRSAATAHSGAGRQCEDNIHYPRCCDLATVEWCASRLVARSELPDLRLRGCV